MDEQEAHIELLKKLSTLDAGKYPMAEGAYLVKITGADSINAGKRLEELGIFNFTNQNSNDQLLKILALRDSIIDIYHRHFLKEYPILIYEGGSRSGKTNNIIRDIVLDCSLNCETWNIIAPSYKMLNLGSFIDIKDFVNENKIDCKLPENATKITFPSGGSIVFEVVVSENEAKRNRKNIYINEADGIPKPIANLVIGRAKGRVLIDYNPTKKFWADDYKLDGDVNVLKTTFRDNPFLSQQQKDWFDRLKKFGENAPEGSPERYAYEVYYLGLYSLLSGKAFELSDFDIREDVPTKFDYMISYSDPSLGVGADYFASLLFGIKNNKVWVLDCIFSQFAKTSGFLEQLKAWDKKYGNIIDHYAESNGTSGVVTKAAKEMYDGVIIEVSNGDKKEADIIVYSTTAKKFKYVKSAKMMSFIDQCVDFPNAEHDDAPDCLTRGAKIILKNFDL